MERNNIPPKETIFKTETEQAGEKRKCEKNDFVWHNRLKLLEVAMQQMAESMKNAIWVKSPRGAAGKTGSVISRGREDPERKHRTRQTKQT